MFSNSVRAPVRLVLPLAVFVVTAPLMAQQPQPQQREHVVKRGDTLWDLARFYLGNPFLWPSIFDANRQVVENPHWIYPAERLIIPPLLQQPAQLPLGDPVAPPVAAVPPAQEPPGETRPTVMATVDLRRPIVPVAEYLAVPWVSTTAERELVGRVVQPRDPAAADDRLAKTLHPTDLVYVAPLGGATMSVGDSLVVVRFGRTVGNRGRVVEPLAVLRVDSLSSSVVIARIARQIADARVGDAILALGQLPEISMGQPEPVSSGPEGRLLEFVVEEPLHGVTDLAFISLGSGDGVGIGDEFAVYVPARAANRDATGQLPPTDIATVRVVKVGERSATVRVLSVSSTALRSGLPIRLIRKMP